jgi:signal transduction histidine kinase
VALNDPDPVHTDILGRAAGPRRPEGTPAAALRLVAHELRAHVAVLGGYTELLRDPAVRDDPGRLDQALHSIGDRLASLRAMSDHLSGVVAGGSRAAHQDAVDLGELGRQAARWVAELARSRGCRVVVEESGDSPVAGDRFQLATAMRNLLENACRHGPRDGEVRLRMTTGESRVRVSVRDQGGGLGRLGQAAFDPLTQGGEPGVEGMGLGLSLVQEVAHQHGGTAFWGHDRDGSWVGLEFPRREAA